MTEVHQKYIRFPEGVAKSGIFVLWWKIFAMKIGPELMAVDKLFRSKHSEDDQAENRKYSRRWHITWTVENWRDGGGYLLLLYYSRWVKYCIDQQWVRTKCYIGLRPSPVFLTNDSSRCSSTDHDLKKTYHVIPKCYKKKFWIIF